MYQDLLTCRRYEGGPIPWDAVQLYIARKGLEPDVGELLWEVVQEMLAAQEKWLSDNRPTKGSSQGGVDA